ncbi:hypothetical protein [Pseudomonas amygdali]|uniref:Uncharacterized protein n=2 Tax=Pseudomonas amygdali pv. lachrymans TaxID=53707 RepID=A0ABR5KRR0_PSEAV|nr:hypothetical protein [Pseudomonas amygdali]AXH60076.1 hypothetical protein PLA107_033160 [Pseudomonas amygdali pv. lachrymans str. M301315]KPC17480.1 Uncharacterized protein AC499_0682 [Pseudomonas amygdali pv. lachrymans]RMT06014.1 hypothetical protein ALP54_06418 [Pseudomonas amygdali pv. lachrymans]
MQKISPYHYPLITSRLTTTNQMDLWDELSSNKASFRERLDPLIERIGPTVLNRVLPLLSLSINGKPIYTWAKLKEIQKAHHTPLDADHEDAWDIDARPTELTMLLTIAFSARPRAADWNTLQRLHEGLNASDRADLNVLFSAFYGVGLDKLFDTTNALWTQPEQIQDIPQARDILGQQFVQTGQAQWKRADRVVNKHRVFLVESYYEHDDEDGSSERVLAHVQVGCAATLEGAIEVAAKILDKITLRYKLDKAGHLEQETPDYRALKIYGEEKSALLSAKLVNPLAGKDPVETKEYRYEAQWRHPCAKNEVEGIKAKIAELRSEAAEESRWDNFDTSNRLSKQAQVLEKRLPSEKHDSYAIQDVLRKTMAKIGNDRQSTALLGVDLGL